VPKDQVENQVLTMVTNLEGLDFSTIRDNPPNLNAWNNLNVADFFESYDAFLESIARFREEGIFKKVPWNIVNSLHGQLNNVFTNSKNFISTKNQQHFQSAFQQLENARTNLQTWGINYLSLAEEELERKSRQIETELQNSISLSREIVTLKKSVEELIKPAVAGSLSNSFQKRKGELEDTRGIWFKVSIAAAMVALIATIGVVYSISKLFEGGEFLSSISKHQASASILWISIVMRLAILVPVYSMFGLAFSQYRRERTLEEEYAHREAVATSLRNYTDLAADENVKDQILSEASKVVFTSPIKSVKERNQDLGQMNQLIDRVSKLVSKRDE